MNRPKARIFALDDEPSIVETWTLILRTQGYDVEAFTSPLDALEAIRENPPDLIVSDVNLPHMTGIDLVITLEKESIPTKVLLCSGAPTTSFFLDRAIAEGHSLEVLAKPVGPRELLRQVRVLLNEESFL